MPSEHSRSSSDASATSVPTINIRRAPTPPDNISNQSNLNTNSNNEQLLDASDARSNGQSKDRNRDKSTSRDRSSSRGKSPGRKSDKRGKSLSPGRKSPSGEKLLSTSKNSNRSRSPSPRPKSPGRSNSSRSKSPRNNHNRVGSDNSNNRSNSQDARVGLGSKILHPWVAPSLNSNGETNNSKSANRLSLPNFTDNASLNNAIRESNERWAKLNLVQAESKGMGNFSKPANSLRVVSTRPKLHVETF
ncbi:14303_t:CDS:1, partial [Racocetra persica]